MRSLTQARYGARAARNWGQGHDKGIVRSREMVRSKEPIRKTAVNTPALHYTDYDVSMCLTVQERADAAF